LIAAPSATRSPRRARRFRLEGGDEALDDGNPLADRHVLPHRLRLPRGGKRPLDLAARRQRPLDIDAIIGRRDRLQHIGHGSLSSSDSNRRRGRTQGAHLPLQVLTRSASFFKRHVVDRSHAGASGFRTFDDEVLAKEPPVLVMLVKNAAASSTAEITGTSVASWTRISAAITVSATNSCR